jgi:hopanoid biosynthesis associated RND transporter like protein HpnN
VSDQPTSHRLTLPERLLSWLADAVYLHPRLFFYPQVLLFGVSVFYTIQKLEFSTSRNDLVGADKKYHRNFIAFKKEFPGQDDLVVIVESDRMEKNRQFVERLGARLETETNLFTDVFYKGDLKMMGNKALLFVPEGDLVEMRHQLQNYRPFIEKFSHATNLVSLFQIINTQFRTAKPEDNAQNQSLIKSLSALQRIIELGEDSLKRPGLPPSPGVNALFGGGEETERQMYITFASGTIYLVTAHAKREELGADAVARLRELVNETIKEVPGVNAGLTGEPVLEFDEMAQSQRDTTIATIVSLALVAFIFIYGYQESGRPIKANVCLVIGLGYTMGYTTLVVGHLNILTITFAPMLIGMAIDFGVHLITRYEEELRHGKTEREAIKKAMVYTGLGIFTGCFTTAGAFFAMAFTDFRGIQEMGIISGGGLLICLVPMMTMLPALLLRGRQNKIDHDAKPQVDYRARLERLWLERPALVIGATATLCALSLAKFPVPFDYDLRNMQSAGLPAVVFEKKLINTASNSVLFGAVMATNLQQAVELEAKLTNLPTVASVRSMSQFLSENPARKLELVRGIKQDVSQVTFPPLDMSPVRVPELSQTLYSFQGYLGAALAVVRKEGDKTLEAQLQPIWDAVGELRKRMLVNPSESALKLADFQQALLDDLHDTFTALKTQDDRAGLRAEDLPTALHNRFVGRTGKYLLQVYPKEDVWQRENQRKFVEDLRKVDDSVTGTPVQLLEYTTLLKESYETAAWYALGAISILVLFHFRSVVCVILALLPVGIGTIWMVGFMGWSGIPFNPANIMTLPLVVGIGVTNGIHILNRFSEEQNPGILAKSTGKAVLVSGLTTIVGFGSLILAKHQGIESLGYVMAVGTATCMIAGLTFLPVLLNLLIRVGWKINRPSGTNALAPLGPEEPR